MAFNKVKLSQIIKDFIITLDGDDYASNASDFAIRNFALRGIREIGFDLGKKIKSLKREIQTSSNSIILPDDFVDLSKIGIVDPNGIIRVLGQNKNINHSMHRTGFDPTATPVVGEISDTSDAGTSQSEAGPLNIEANIIDNVISSKSPTNTGGSSTDDNLDFYIFENYLYQGGMGRLYGTGGGYLSGEYRVNLQQNRIEIESNDDISEVVIEYVADEARSTDPEVHVYAEEALRCYMYYKIIERKSSVPANEKARARAEYYNERRKANARLSNFTKEEALKTIRKNFMQAPKY
tara:strand:+ start:2926 stop:3807 length:882 start_codon:yes stop_codon:yes gene_type:complete